VVQPDALATEHGQVVRAVEVLHPLRVLRAQLLLQRVLVVLDARAALVEVEVGLGQDGVFLDHLVEDVDVQRKALGALELLDEFAADGAAHAAVVVQRLDAARAQRVPAVDQDARDALAHVVPEAAELTDVQAPRTVVQVQDLGCR